METLRYDARRDHLEGWLARGAELRRVFAHRPTADREYLAPGVYKAVLQEVHAGIVHAWAPIWCDLVDRAQLEARVAGLVAEGWTLTPFRPVPVDHREACLSGLRGHASLGTPDELAAAAELRERRLAADRARKKRQYRAKHPADQKRTA